MRRLTLVIFILYALLTTYSVISLVFHQTPMQLLTPITTLTGFTFALLHAGQREGWQRALRLLALVFGVSLLFESSAWRPDWSTARIITPINSGRFSSVWFPT